MPAYFALSHEDQREALPVAAERSGRPLHLLEKDVWGVWARHHLFTGPRARHLVFKGGTSPSKAYGVLKRFSEDVDLTVDIHAIAMDLIEHADSPWPTSRSPEKKWRKACRQRLAELVSGKLAPDLAKALAEQGLQALARAPKSAYRRPLVGWRQHTAAVRHRLGSQWKIWGYVWGTAQTSRSKVE